MLHFMDFIQLWLDSGAERATMATTCAIGKITFNGVLLFSQKVQDEIAKR